MNPLQRLALSESVEGLLICPVLLRCNVCIKLADARLSWFSDIFSGEGLNDLVRGRANCGIGTVSSGIMVEVGILPVLVDTLSDMEGRCRLVFIECAEERRECRASRRSPVLGSERPLTASDVGKLVVLLAGACGPILVKLCLARGRRLIWRRNECLREGSMFVGGD
jgi:hypothetical protein